VVGIVTVVLEVVLVVIVVGVGVVVVAMNEIYEIILELICKYVPVRSYV
jgi:hypothetical protein